MAPSEGMLPTGTEEVVKDPLSRGFERVMGSYLQAKGEEFAEHALARFLRKDLTELVTAHARKSVPTLKVKGSVGQSTWAHGPWIGILDPLITSSVQRGYYVCYLLWTQPVGATHYKPRKAGGVS